MRRHSVACREGLRAAAVAVLAFTFVDFRAADPGLVPASRENPVYTRNPERVALRVDGWIIEVDRVNADAMLAETSPPVPVRERLQVPPPGATSGTLSRYDHLIQRHAASQGLDWRLVAALIEEESGFKPEAVSAKGAVGLMQVRPIAADDVGEPYFASPDDNIRTGVRYLKRLESIFAPAGEGRNRLALVLAAYNTGPAHVQDAQVLARTYGFDPRRWDNSMALMLPLLEDPRFFQRLPSGYAQGRNAVTYVERILNRYERYKVEAGEFPGLVGPSGQAASASG